MLPDNELLRRYVETGDQRAFTELAQRHANCAYRTALRNLGGDAHAAKDVVQQVLVGLARKAPALTRHHNLAGWIHVSARYEAVDAVRTLQRRRLREERAAAELDRPAEMSWSRLEPVIDELLAGLPAHDREVLVLHFLEGRPFPEVGGLLAMNADAVRMRVNRALERLRIGLDRRGLATSTAVLGEILFNQSTLAADLPSVAALAAQAMETAVQLGPAGGGSLLPAKFQFIRSIPVGGWVAGIVIVGGLAYYGQGRQHDLSREAPPTTTQLTHVTSEIPEADTLPASEEPLAAPLERSGRTTTAVAETAFTDLTAPEERILKILWSREVEFGSTPGKRWAVTVSPDKPNYREIVAARRSLRLRGWVGVNRRGAVFLTEPGLAYCIGQRQAIDAYPMPNTRPADELAGQAGN